jgi:hypothetical protein
MECQSGVDQEVAMFPGEREGGVASWSHRFGAPPIYGSGQPDRPIHTMASWRWALRTWSVLVSLEWRSKVRRDPGRG